MTTIVRISDAQRERMRRSIGGVDQGPTDQEQERGVYPYRTSRFLRGLSDPQDPTAVSFPFLRRMRKDHMVAMGLHFIRMGYLGAPWYIQADDARVATYADKVLRAVYYDLARCILRMLWAGYGPGAINYDQVQPGWTYVDGDEVKRVWDNPAIDVPVFKSVTPLIPESSKPVFKNGAFNGITYDLTYGDVGTSFIIDGQETPNVDLMHSIWLAHDSIEEDGSPYGVPRIAYCAPIFWMFRYIWDLCGRAFERSADPGPIVRYPLDEAPAIGDDGARVKNNATALKLGQRRRSGSTITMPSDVWRGLDERMTSIKKWDLEYPEAKTDFESLMRFLGYLEASKLRALGMSELGVTEGSGGTSSRNVSAEANDQRDKSQDVLIKEVDDYIVKTKITPLVQIVFPFYTGELRKITLSLDDAQMDLQRQFIQLAGQENFLSFGVDMRRVAEINGFPLLDPVEQKRRERERAQSVVAHPPAVKPTQGRRSLVTQTGFDEWSYHQLGAQAPLSDVALSTTDDGDFVASLPRCAAFEDSVVLDEARRIRARAQTMLARATRDVVYHLGRHRFDGISPSGALELWQPDQRLRDDASYLDARLAAVVERAAAVEGRRVGASMERADAAGLRRLASRGADVVEHMLSRVRDEARAAVADVDVDDWEDAGRRVADALASSPRARAAEVAVEQARLAYRHGVLAVGEALQIAWAQQPDGSIVALADAGLDARLLPSAPAGLTIRREQLDDGVLARYDRESETVLVSVDVPREEEKKYMLELGDAFARPLPAG